MYLGSDKETRGYYCWVGVSAPRTADDAVELESDDEDEELSVAMV